MVPYCQSLSDIKCLRLLRCFCRLFPVSRLVHKSWYSSTQGLHQVTNTSILYINILLRAPYLTWFRPSLARSKANSSIGFIVWWTFFRKHSWMSHAGWVMLFWVMLAEWCCLSHAGCTRKLQIFPSNSRGNLSGRVKLPACGYRLRKSQAAFLCVSFTYKSFWAEWHTGTAAIVPYPYLLIIYRFVMYHTNRIVLYQSILARPFRPKIYISQAASI